MTTQPIKNLKKLEELKNYYKLTVINPRNYTLISVGVNTALRISDILLLTWGDIYDFNKKDFKRHIKIIEKKTKKENIIAINKNLEKVFKDYKRTLNNIEKTDYLFWGKNGRKNHLSRAQAFRIIKNAALAIHLEENISCHSLRKTFGYHAWKSGVSPVLIMDVYNHSSYNITKRYIGIDQDDKDNIFLKMNL